MTLFGLAAAIATLWWAVFALKPYEITSSELTALYAHAGATPTVPQVLLGPPEPITVGTTMASAQSLRFASFDGVEVLGRLVLPAGPPRLDQPTTARPVLLALHGMGRTHWRWWQDEFKGRATIESTHLLAERALQAGYAVVALDARAHGDRKDPRKPLISREMMTDLYLWGRREPYERLIVDTVRDYRMLLDWIGQQREFEIGQVRAAGYSMGAQMALLLAATDRRVRSVAAMVPPHLDCTVAAVAPISLVSRLADVPVWLLTADDDEHASRRENADLFAALPGSTHRHLTFPGGHVLPASYVEHLKPWLMHGYEAPVSEARSAWTEPPSVGPADALASPARCSA